MAVTIRQLRDHFFSSADWLNPDATCDKVVYGELDREVRKIGTGWLPCSQNLTAAAADGCDLFISHETCFYGTWKPNLDSRETAWGLRRMDILKKNNMACMNQHDTWDYFPEFGIRDSWRAFLGLTELIAERPYYFTPGEPGQRLGLKNALALSRVQPQSLREFASLVAKKCSIFPSSNGVTVYGNLNAQVGTVATGAGCAIPALEMMELGADALIVTFDRAFQSCLRIPLIEMDANLIVVEHGTAEMPGMQNMAIYLKQKFPGIETAFYCHEPSGEILLS